MVKLVFKTLRFALRIFFTLIIIVVLVSIGFVVYKGSQPMSIQGAHGLTYWQFMNNRLQKIQGMQANCQELHITDFALSVPFYPVLYTFDGLYPASLLARMTMPDPAIPKNVRWYQVPGTWWSLVETISWEALVTPHLPAIMPQCNLKLPASSG